MTKRLYYADPYRAVFAATVAWSGLHDGRPAVVLDATAFYPTSGGQPFDTGTLGGARVLDVIDSDDDTVLHVLDAPLEVGTQVEGRIDWPRRFDHMQQHTGQHVLSAAFARRFDNPTVSFHMSADVSTLDLAREASQESIAEAEREANRVVWENRPVSIRFASGEEAARLNLRKEPSRAGTLRLIEVAEFDLSACGGTHVDRTGSIGVIAVSGTERFRGGTRVTFVCGNRALRVFRTYRDALAGSVRLLSVLPGELPGAIDRLQGDAKELRRTVKTMQDGLARYEAARLVSEAPVVDGIRVVACSLHGWDAAGLKAIAASAVASEPVAVALFSTESPVTVVIARAANVNVDAHAILKTLVGEFGGRGGGKPDLAQGGGLAGDATRVMAAARAAMEKQLSARQ